MPRHYHAVVFCPFQDKHNVSSAVEGTEAIEKILKVCYTIHSFGVLERGMEQPMLCSKLHKWNDLERVILQPRVHNKIEHVTPCVDVLHSEYTNHVMDEWPQFHVATDYEAQFWVIAGVGHGHCIYLVWQAC